MRRRLLAVLLLACAVSLLVLTTSAQASEPPSQRDPCSEAGRDTCGTLGVGSYETYRYGLRWFGDYRGAVAGIAHTFCIDLRWWYPARAYRYRELAAGALENTDGGAVSAGAQERMAYAIWRYGQSRSPTQQAAVMLYVHGLMGDARPGEADAGAIGATVARLYARIARDARRYHGPYRVVLALPSGMTVGRRAVVRVKVLAASGAAVPGVTLAVATTGAANAPARVTTGSDGIGTFAFLPTSADGVRVRARSGYLASTRPRVFKAAAPTAARNAQRLAAAASQRVEATVSGRVAKARLTLSTLAVPATMIAGQSTRDRLTLRGALASFRATVAVRLHGPFATREAVRCDGAPAWSTTVRIAGSGFTSTPRRRLATPGWYTYVEVIPGDPSHTGVTTPCGVPAETLRVDAQPRVTTRVSDQTVAPGTPITDSVHVAGLAGLSATVHAALYGPFPTRTAVDCSARPIWSGDIAVAADGDYATAPFTVTVPGYYTYREWIDAAGLVRAATTRCGQAVETTLATGAPQVVTQVSATDAKPGAVLRDRVSVTGLGALSVPVVVDLHGPFPTRAAIRCTGAPYWRGAFRATGDGTYRTAGVRLQRAGYYTYRERIATSEAVAGTATPCAEATETTFVHATPTVSTVVDHEVVRPGTRITDRIRVAGLGRTTVRIKVSLYGPFSTRAAIGCTTRRLWTGRVFAHHDGVVRSPAVKVGRVGFYTFREELVGSPLVSGVLTPCGVVAETSLGAPAISTGRGDVVTETRARAASGRAPTRIAIAARGIDAPVSAVGIDLAHGALGVPAAISRTGWWVDGATPGDAAGSVLIAGHVDSATAGAGAFFNLKSARPGDRARVTTADGRVRTYRIVSVRTLAKPLLPLDIWSRQGRARLVLVTCGGPFSTTLGHYRDNVVVTAVPV